MRQVHFRTGRCWESLRRSSNHLESPWILTPPAASAVDRVVPLSTHNWTKYQANHVSECIRGPQHSSCCSADVHMTATCSRYKVTHRHRRHHHLHTWPLTTTAIRHVPFSFSLLRAPAYRSPLHGVCVVRMSVTPSQRWPQLHVHYNWGWIALINRKSLRWPNTDRV